MKKLLLFLLLVFSVVSVQAMPSISTLPSNITLECGNNYNEVFQLDGEKNNTISEKIQGTGSSYFMALDDSGVNSLRVSIFYIGPPCSTGFSTFSFKLDETLYEIELEVTDTLFQLERGFPLVEGQKFSVGNTIHFNLINVGLDFVTYLLEGCGSLDESTLYYGGALEKTCGTERLGVEIDEILGSEVATFNISFSSPSLNVQKSYSDTNGGGSSECVLGIDTLGAVVKRGSVFAFNTINANTGKYESNVIVNVLDQAGDLTPLSGTSDNTGFFSKRIHEDYKQDLLIKLFKDGCEPTNKVILFEQSYDDYKKAKQEEEGGYHLVLNMSERYEMKAISGTIKNLLDEVIDGVEVKITNPDNSIVTVQTNANGVFSFTPVAVGVYKLQGGKENYESTDLVSIEVYQNKQYLIVVKVDGKQKSEYKKGDSISFELRDENNTLIPLSIDATFAGLPLRFVSGISDTVTLEDTSTLSIPATEGYIAQSLPLTIKKTDWADMFYWILGIIGVIVILILVVAIRRKVKGPKKPGQKMEIQLGEGEG